MPTDREVTDPMPKARTLFAGLLLTLGLMTVSPTRAAAAISANQWTRSTIYVQQITPGDSWGADVTSQIDYLTKLGTSGRINWTVINGTCRVGYPCIHLYEGLWGTGTAANPTFFGLTNFAADCFVNGLCNWDGSTAQRTDHTSNYWTTVKLNKSWPSTPSEIDADACHELGHAVGGLLHATGDTCMNATIGSNTADYYTSTEISQMASVYVNEPHRASLPAPVANRAVS